VHLEYKKVSIKEARKAMDHPLVLKEDWGDSRLPQSFERLSANTGRWLLSLPKNVRPLELAKRFPRIANKIYQLRDQSRRLSFYLDDLLIVKRRQETRQGFPPRIASEIARLSAWITGHERK